MRQGQQNRRGRGRNRKSQNPMTRSFESTGPDVKLRGTPSHIAEKYMSLARDALSSGDPVLAENYMQHAEHYNRIIMTFREQQISQGGGDPFAAGMARPATMGGNDMDDGDDFGDDEAGDFNPLAAQPDMQPPMQQPAQPQQQFGEPRQRFDNRSNNQHRRDNRHNNHRHDRNDNRYDRGDRGDRQDFRGDRGDRGDRQDFRGERHDRNNGNGENRGFRDDRRDQQGGEGGGERPMRRERFQAPPLDQPASVAPAAHEQPEFLRRPVRRPRAAETGEGAPPPARNGDDQE